MQEPAKGSRMIFESLTVRTRAAVNARLPDFDLAGGVGFRSRPALPPNSGRFLDQTAGKLALLVAITLVAASPVLAHVGSPDVFYEGNAGPYHLLVTIRPPTVVPGIAEIEIRSVSEGLQELRVVPLELAGPGAKLAPRPDVAVASVEDPHLFTANLWLMKTGTWQVRITANGSRGQGELMVPVPALAQRILGMQRALAVMLFAMMLVLAIGVIGIVGAATREGMLDPDVVPSRTQVFRARLAMGAATIWVLVVILLGNAWWNSEASSYSRQVYRPMELLISYQPHGRLLLRARDPGWLVKRNFADLVPDHGHLMHLILVRMPGMDVFWHLHPRRIDGELFEDDLPAIPGGRYQAFADIVHESGLAETMVATIDLPEVTGTAPSGDDSGVMDSPLSEPPHASGVSKLPGGGQIIWENYSSPLKIRVPALFRFRVVDENGKSVSDLEPYMGMAGHAILIRSDGSVFAHVHPAGSVPMAVIALSQKSQAQSSGGPADELPMSQLQMDHMMDQSADSSVSFPYGFPKNGDYRIWIQIKRGGHIATGAFDVTVD
jgi:hypothetical protein